MGHALCRAAVPVAVKGGCCIKYLYLHLSVFFAILFLLCGGLYLSRRTSSRFALAQLEDLRAAPKAAADSLAPVPSIFVTGGPIPQPNMPPSAYDAPAVLPEYQSLYEQNSDLIGWVQIPDTMLNLPVMHTPWDNEYYLRRLFDGTESLYGIPFLDGDCSVTPRSTNLILHGHHMRDGTMFSTLAEYMDEGFYQAHPTIRFDTIYEKGLYEIIAVFHSVYDESDRSPDLYYNFIDAADQADFDRFIRQVKERSLYDTGKTAAYGDELITLITCMYDVDNGRMNVVAKKIPFDSSEPS